MARTAVGTRASSVWLALLAGVAGVGAWYALVRPGSPARTLTGDLLLLVLPAAGAVLCARTAEASPPLLRGAWRAFALAAAVAAFGQLVVLTGYYTPLEIDWRIPFTIFLAFHPIFAAGAVLSLGTRPGDESPLELALDAALLLACGGVVLLRFVWEPTIAAGGRIDAGMVWLLLIQVAALGSVFAAALLAFWEDTAMPSPAIAALLSAAAVFAIGNILAAKGFGSAHGGTFLDLVWIAGWTFLVGAAVSGRRLRPALQQRRSLSSLSDRLTRGLVPAAALLLAFIAIHGVDAPLAPETAIGLGVVGLLLGLRSWQALGVARRGRADTERLAHTRALIEVSHSLAASTDLGKALDAVSEWAARLLHAPSAGIELLSADGERLEMRSIWQLPAEALQLRFPVARSYTGQVLRDGVARATADAANEPLMHRASLGYLGNATLAAAPIRFRDRKLGVLFTCMRADPFSEDDLALLQALADQAGIAIENARLFEEVRGLSMTDPLTGLANRRQLEHDLGRDFAAARRGRPLSLVLFDLDDFKRYNDTRGHPAGDALLRTFADALRQVGRAMNLAVRYGGDEFLALLADSDAAGARIFVERVRNRFAELLAVRGMDPMTFSAGIAEFGAAMASPEELILAADQALYAVKARKEVDDAPGAAPAPAAPGPPSEPGPSGVAPTAPGRGRRS